MPALVAYFDTNTIDHMYRLQHGVTAATVALVKEAVSSKRLLIPASTMTAEELLSAANRRPADAFGLGQLYLDLASLRHCVKGARTLMTESISSYARRSADPAPYVALAHAEKRAWKALATGGDASERDSLLQEAKAQIEQHLQNMIRAWDAAQATVESFHRENGRRPEFSDLWRLLALAYVRYAAKCEGALHACTTRGMKGLLGRRPVLAAAGVQLGLIHAHAVNRRKPDAGDSRDALHVIMAAAVGRAFVTHDERLGKLVRQIPGLGMEVLTVPELALRLP